MIHELKILPEYFKEVVSGTKNFEVRKNDRDFKVGDRLLLRVKKIKMKTNIQLLIIRSRRDKYENSKTWFIYI